jgi:hypothetical protein
MKCQSFWLLDPSRLSLTVLSVAALAGAGAVCANAEAAHNTHGRAKDHREKFSIRDTLRRPSKGITSRRASS